MSIVDYRNDEYHRLRHPELLEDGELFVAWSHFADDAYFKTVKPGQTVLEFGGGLGNNLAVLSKRASVCMVEPSAVGRSSAQAHGIEAVQDLGCLAGRRFDLVLCRHVLEHVEHPLMCIQQLANHIAPHGRLLLVIPVEPNNLKPRPNDLDHHLYCWNPQTTHNLLQTAGLKVLEWHYEFYGARRKLLPVYRKFGGRAYARSIRFLGRLFQFKELVVVAAPGA